VADDAPNNAGPFDVGTVKQLVLLMSRNNLSEIYLRQGDQVIRLRRGGAAPAAPVAYVPAPAAVPAATPPPAAAPAGGNSSPAPAAPSRALHEIKSEVIGTFYSAPDPKKPPFVQVGSRVNAGDVLCLVEAMKTYNEVTADRPGVIVEICVQNQQSVEFGQVLFRLDPTG
jgi:acetyl-CoA carboxylase biotin carboxyl carrier protein